MILCNYVSGLIMVYFSFGKTSVRTELMRVMLGLLVWSGHLYVCFTTSWCSKRQVTSDSITDVKVNQIEELSNCIYLDIILYLY